LAFDPEKNFFPPWGCTCTHCTPWLRLWPLTKIALTRCTFLHIIHQVLFGGRALSGVAPPHLLADVAWERDGSKERRGKGREDKEVKERKKKWREGRGRSLLWAIIIFRPGTHCQTTFEIRHCYHILLEQDGKLCCSHLTSVSAH